MHRPVAGAAGDQAQDVQILDANPGVDVDQAEDKAVHPSAAAPVVDEASAEAAQVAAAAPSVQAEAQVEIVQVEAQVDAQNDQAQPQAQAVQVQVPTAAPGAVEAEAEVFPAVELSTPEAGEDVIVHRAAGDFTPPSCSLDLDSLFVTPQEPPSPAAAPAF